MEGQGFPRGRCDLHPGFRDHPQALSSVPHRNASVIIFMTFLNQTVRGSPPWRAPVSLFPFLFPWYYRRALQPHPPPLLLKALGLGSHSSLCLPRLLCLTLSPLSPHHLTQLTEGVLHSRLRGSGSPLSLSDQPVEEPFLDSYTN